MRQLVQLQKEIKSFNAIKVQVVGISYDSAETLAEFTKILEITFPLLSDVESKTIKAFGIHNQNGLPHPGTIFIDANGVIRAKLFNDEIGLRHSPKELLETARKIRRSTSTRGGQ